MVLPPHTQELLRRFAERGSVTVEQILAEPASDRAVRHVRRAREERLIKQEEESGRGEQAVQHGRRGWRQLSAKDARRHVNPDQGGDDEKHDGVNEHGILHGQAMHPAAAG